jgi:hypothetical protein
LDKKVATAITLVLVLCFFSTTGISLAQTQAGVAKGDVFTYSFSITYSGSFPSDAIELSKIDWIRFTITDVSGFHVTCAETYHYFNGSEYEMNRQVDVRGAAFSGEMPITMPNLSVNDPLVRDSNVLVNETIMRSYPQSNREVNHVYFNLRSNSLSDPNGYSDFYFDKQTGVLVERHESNWGSDPSWMANVTVKLIESSVWEVSGTAIPSPSGNLSPSPSVPEFPSTIFIITFLFTATLLGTVVIKIKQSRRM